MSISLRVQVCLCRCRERDRHGYASSCPGCFAALWVAPNLLAASCNSNGTTSIPTTLPPSPSAVVSAVLDAAQTQFCQHVSQLQIALVDLQASPTPDVASAASALDTVASNLRSDADQLSSAAHPDLATAANGIAGAVDLLRGLVISTTLPSGFETAVAVVGTALGQLPQGVCPAGTPSP
jgi:hypothetical protein